MGSQSDSRAHTQPFHLAQACHTPGRFLKVSTHPCLLFLIKGDDDFRIFINNNK